MKTPANEFHNGVKHARQQVIAFIEQHIDGEHEFLTLAELIKEIKHWESKDTEYSLRAFDTGELIISVKGKVIRISEEVNA